MVNVPLKTPCAFALDAEHATSIPSKITLTASLGPKPEASILTSMRLSVALTVSTVVLVSMSSSHVRLRLPDLKLTVREIIDCTISSTHLSTDGVRVTFTGNGLKVWYGLTCIDLVCID